jgi:osmotically-inducible protein OsmY
MTQSTAVSPVIRRSPVTRLDNDIQRDIVAELKWEASLRDDDIAVGIRDGIVTLGGFVDSYADKHKAERVVGRIKGVKAMANEIEVKLPAGSRRADPDIARAVVDALRWNVAVPRDAIRVKVEDGWVTLEGEVPWYYQKRAAEETVRYLTGVRGVSNLVTLKVEATPRDVKKRIKDALHRAVEVDADHMTVEIEGHRATLSGSVRSLAEIRDAERAARNAPGITEVVNRLEITRPYAAV